MKHLKNFLKFIVFSFSFSIGFYSYGGSGKKFFDEKEFLEAAKSFKKEKNTKSLYWLGKSLFHLDMYYSASLSFTDFLKDSQVQDKITLNEAVKSLIDLEDYVDLDTKDMHHFFEKNDAEKILTGDAHDYSQHYRAASLFKEKKFKEAEPLFLSIKAKSPFYLKSKLYLGVMASLEGRRDEGLKIFLALVHKAKLKEKENIELLDEAYINIARIYYENKKFKESLKYYSLVSRFSKQWIEAIFEASWSFFMLKKYNNALGSLHTVLSPFFERHFFAEAYLLQSLSFLKMCRFEELQKSINAFNVKFEKNAKHFALFLGNEKKSSHLYNIIISRIKGEEKPSHKKISVFLDALIYTDEFKKAYQTDVSIDLELEKIRSNENEWGDLGKALTKNLTSLKKKNHDLATEKLIQRGSLFIKKINAVSDQIQIIHAEMLLGKVDKVRAKLKKQVDVSKNNDFIGGMRELKIGEALEYWPFEGEYWEDELGGYVYNLNNLCKKN